MLVVTEIALACVLLVGSGLLIRSFAEVLQVDLGFQPQHALAWRVDASRSFDLHAERVQYYDDLAERVSAIPGVESAGLSDTLPLGYKRQWSIRAAGVTYERGHVPEAYVRMIDDRCLQTLRVPLRSGRFFDGGDSEHAQKVTIVSETLARNLWPGQDPVGRSALVSGREYTVVGVVADIPHGLEETPQPDMYFNLRQIDDWQSPELIVRSRRPLESIMADVRKVIREFDPSLPTNEFISLDTIVGRAIAPRRLITGILGAFSMVALVLAAIGLYGVIAYSVGQRTREIGVRAALGARRSDILRLIVGEGMRLAVVGVAVGLGAAFLVTRVLQAQLFGVDAADPLTFATNAAIVGGVTLLASVVPARRAAKVDPMIALRAE
jgi:predicted permease